MTGGFRSRPSAGPPFQIVFPHIRPPFTSSSHSFSRSEQTFHQPSSVSDADRRIRHDRFAMQDVVSSNAQTVSNVCKKSIQQPGSNRSIDQTLQAAPPRPSVAFCGNNLCGHPFDQCPFESRTAYDDPRGAWRDLGEIPSRTEAESAGPDPAEGKI